MSLEHDHTLNPVTALEFFHYAGNLLVLAGEGTYLKVFEANSGKIICQCRIFDAQTVHGIVLAPDATSDDLQLVIWGGSSLVLLSASILGRLISQNIAEVTELEVVTADWILHVVIDPSRQGCVFVTAHNTLFQARFGTDETPIDFKSLSSPSRSILYSAHLIYDTTDLILVAAGTVFGEIIVWECALPKIQESAGCRVLCTLTGHEGSIFGVNISPTVTDSHGTQTRLLASCSDDRTIRLWDIFGHSKDRPSREHAYETGTLRETGFGDTSHLGSEVADTCLAMCMGHASRIWGVKFYQTQIESPNSYSSINVLSFGEDSTTQRWNLGSWQALGNVSKGAKYAPQQLNHVSTFAYHRGKHIWSRATRDLGLDGTLLVTGGADGRIPIYRIPFSSEVDILDLPIYREVNELHTQVANTSSNEIDPGRQISDDQSVRSSMFDLDQILNQFKKSDDESVELEKDGEPLTVVKSANMPQEAITSELVNESEYGPENTELAPTSKKKKPKPKKIRKDALNRYDFVSDDELILITTFGRILHCYIGLNVLWREICCHEIQHDALKSYSIIKGSPKLNAVFLAGATGDIYMYRSDIHRPENVASHWQLTPTVESEVSNPSLTLAGTDLNRTDLITVGKLDSKVAEMIVVTDLETSSLILFAIPITGKTITKFFISFSDGYKILRTNKLQLPETFLVTSAQKLGSFTVLGARNGAISVYENDDEMPSLIYPAQHGEKDTITSIIKIKAQVSQTGDISFLTTCRNGAFSIFTVTEQKELSGSSPGLSISRVHYGTPPFGPMIESAWFNNSDLYLYGFRSKYFVIWNETQQYQVAEIECGGAHRTYAYSPLGENNRGGHFAYTKASKLYIHTQKGDSHKFIKEGGHGREIKSSAVSPNGKMIATGAEDTMIRLWRYHDQGTELENSFESLAVIKKHTTGIQHLQWHGNQYLFSSGGTEEFYVWAVTSIQDFGVGIVCEAVCPDRSEDGDLRITSFDVSDMPDSKGDQAELLISIAYSDSTIRIYRYSKQEGFNLLNTGRYTAICLTQLRHVYLDEEQLFILTAATDGKMAIWKTLLPAIEGSSSTSSELELISTNKIHQNSIKCLDICRLSEGRFIVATGGDDNAIGMAVYNKDILMSGTAPTRTILRSAHAAAITGLAFITGKDIQLASSGNDQRVKNWQLSVDEQNSQIADFSNTGDVFTSIADVGDLSVLRGSTLDSAESKVLVFGVGMDVWRVGKKC